MELPETRDARSGDVSIASQVLGDGPFDLVHLPPKVGGIAVNIGARVASAAGPSEVLVSSTVRDLVAGSGIELRERGVAELTGVPGEWRLFAVERA